MKFNYDLFEGNFKDIYLSTVNSFPTKKRQHSVDTIKIVNLNWVPYLGVKTLFIKALAQNVENGKEYNPILLFKNINFLNNKIKDSVEIIDRLGRTYLLEKIKNNDVLLRCNCKDFFWRGNYADHLKKYLYGSKRSKYYSKSGLSVNPNNDPLVCKHIIKLYIILNKSGLLF